MAYCHGLPIRRSLQEMYHFNRQALLCPLIYLLTLSDAKQTLLTSPDGMVQGVGTWSPNGEQLLYFKGGSMSENVYVMNADGSHQLALSNDDLGMVTEASWSPDGTRVVFSTLKLQGDNKYYFLYTVKADGNDLISLSKNPLSFLIQAHHGLPMENILFLHLSEMEASIIFSS